jgi:hypothetical protein
MNRAITQAIPSLLFLAILTCCGNLQEKKPLPPELQSQYIAKGQTIVTRSFQSLTSELQIALQNGGVQNAIGYCHLRAAAIIDSLSEMNDIKISRVSDRNRNPNNEATELDQLILKEYNDQLASGRPLQPHLEVDRGDTIYYSPIVIQTPMCLICHGEPGATIQNLDYDFIRSKYPDDRATGYKLNDLRGLWKVEF